jgi:hypothetical protein
MPEQNLQRRGTVRTHPIVEVSKAFQ